MKWNIKFNESETARALADPQFMSALFKIKSSCEKLNERIHIYGHPGTKTKKIRSLNETEPKNSPADADLKEKPRSNSLKGKPAIIRSEKICPHCKISYKPRSNAQVYCSDECNKASKNGDLTKNNSPEIPMNEEIPVKDTEGHPDRGESYYKKNLKNSDRLKRMPD